MRNGENDADHRGERKRQRADREPDPAEVAITTPQDPPAGQDTDEDDQGERVDVGHLAGDRTRQAAQEVRGIQPTQSPPAWCANEGPHATAHSQAGHHHRRSPRPRPPIPAKRRRPRACRPRTGTRRRGRTVQPRRWRPAPTTCHRRRSLEPPFGEHRAARRRGARAARTSEPRRHGGSGRSCTRAPPSR